MTTAEPTPLREARRFFEELETNTGRPATVVFNKQLPETWTESKNLRSPDLSVETRQTTRENLNRWASEVHLQHDIKQEFAARYGLHLLQVPWAKTAPTSVDALADLLARSPELVDHVLR